VGETLTADPGSWSDSTPMTTFSSQWERLVEGAWTPIAGAAAATYVPTAGDLGHALRVRVGTDGAADALSEPTQPVRAAAEPTPAATPTPVAIPVAPDGHATLEPVVIGVASGDTTVTVIHDSVGVRCAMSGATLRSCRVELFADPTADGARASRVVRIGSGTVHAASPASRLSVHVKLNRTGRRLLRRSPTGLDVRVNVTGDPVEGATLHGRTSARLVAPRATLIIGGFGPDAARLTRGARAALRTLAGQLDAGSRVRIAGYTAHGHRTLGYLRGLGLRRAAHVRDFLVAKGAKARTTVLTHGPGDPEAGNGTARGRALNRRVVLTIVR
jgi:outer membrane protein OmpA-like peptidoglycan-associated protein